MRERPRERHVGHPLFSYSFNVLRYCCLLSSEFSFNFFTIGANPSLLNTEISADEMVLLVIMLCCVRHFGPVPVLVSPYTAVRRSLEIAIVF